MRALYPANAMQLQDSAAVWRVLKAGGVTDVLRVTTTSPTVEPAIATQLVRCPLPAHLACANVMNLVCAHARHVWLGKSVPPAPSASLAWKQPIPRGVYSAFALGEAESVSRRPTLGPSWGCPHTAAGSPSAGVIVSWLWSMASWWSRTMLPTTKSQL